MVDMLFMQKQQNNSLNFMYTYDDMHDNFFTTHIFNSKKYLTKYTWNINETEKNLKLMQNNKLIIFDIYNKNLDMLLNNLWFLEQEHKHCGIVAILAKQKLYYFPKLNYGDAYLIKDIFIKKFSNISIKIFVGKQAI